jgi:hypothetical protein
VLLRHQTQDEMDLPEVAKGKARIVIVGGLEPGVVVVHSSLADGLEGPAETNNMKKILVKPTIRCRLDTISEFR